MWPAPCSSSLLAVQFRLRRYVPGVYWAVVVVISVFGTLITDNMTDHYNVPLTTSTACSRSRWPWCSRLVRSRAHAVDPHHLHLPPRGVLLADDPVHLRPGHRRRRPLGREARPRLRRLDRDLRRPDRRWSPSPTTRFRLNAVLSFWLAYILTRPLGASIGDFMSQHSKKYGGLGLGTTGTSYIFLGCILALVTYLTITRRDVIEHQQQQEAPPPAGHTGQRDHLSHPLIPGSSRRPTVGRHDRRPARPAGRRRRRPGDRDGAPAGASAPPAAGLQA